MKALVGQQVEVTARPLEEPTASEPPRAAGEPVIEPDPDAKPIQKNSKQKPLTVTAIKSVRQTCG